MGRTEPHQVTMLLAAMRDGDASAADRLLPVVYDELRAIARSRMGRLPPGQTLQPTALVHEAYLKIVGPDGAGGREWDDRAHFFGAAARAMRNILVDHARRKGAIKHGGDRARAAFDEDTAGAIEAPAEDMLALDEALTALEREDARAHQVVMLRFFAGLTEEQTADVLGVNPRTVRREWAFARSVLHRALDGAGPASEPTHEP